MHMEVAEKRKRITYSVLQSSEGVCAALFFTGILVGTLLFNCHGGKYAAQFLILMNLSQEGYQQITISYGRLAWYILERRGKRFALLWFCEMTRFQRHIRYLFALYYGLSAGFFQSALCHKNGVLGILEFVLLLFPHYFIYALDWKGLQGFMAREKRGILSLKILLLFLVGILLEVYVNTAILQKYYEILTSVR